MMDTIVEKALRAAASISNAAAKEALELIKGIGDRMPTDAELEEYVGVKDRVESIYAPWIHWKVSALDDDADMGKKLAALITGLQEIVLKLIKKKYDAEGELSGDNILDAMMENVGELMNPFGDIIKYIKEDIPEFDADTHESLAVAAHMAGISRWDSRSDVLTNLARRKRIFRSRQS